jgi:hypothetical protein
MGGILPRNDQSRQAQIVVKAKICRSHFGAPVGRYQRFAARDRLQRVSLLK